MSVILPVDGSSRPMKLLLWSVYQTMPSEPTAGSCGKALSRGIRYSVIASGAAATLVGPARACSAGTRKLPTNDRAAVAARRRDGMGSSPGVVRSASERRHLIHNGGARRLVVH